MARPIAFLVMPYGTRATDVTGDDTPAEVDFDALWDRVYEPLLRGMGYNPVRADQDVGALIIPQMVQRLALADLIVADVTLPNANVYYEIGVRHAAKRHGCVLAAASWAKPVFDLAQMTRIRYPLRNGTIDKATAASARRALTKKLAPLAEGVSPVFDAVPGYPGEVDPARISAFADFVAELSEFQARTRSVRSAPQDERPAMARALAAEYGRSTTVLESVAVELLILMRDFAGWNDVVAYVGGLPKRVQRLPFVREQHYLAMAKVGDTRAVGLLEQLIADEGESAERRGLLGGRYKRLHLGALNPADRRRYLDMAIEQYELGMRADLNAYYPSSNLPRLYRSRRDPGDERKAEMASVTALAACERALDRGQNDGWLRATLLGAAFDAGDVDKASQLVREIRRESPARWQLASTLADLRVSVAQQVDPEVTEQLQAVLTELESLVAPPIEGP